MWYTEWMRGIERGGAEGQEVSIYMKGNCTNGVVRSICMRYEKC